MGTLSLVLEYLKDLEECIDDGDSRVAKEAKLFDALEHKSVVIDMDNKKIAIFTKAPLRAFGEPFMRYSLPCKVDGQGAWDAELDLADLTNYVTEKVLENMGFVHVSLSDYGRKMVNDVNVDIHRVKFKANFVVLDYVNEGEPSILFGRDFLATTKSQVDFRLGEIRMNLTMFEEGIDMIDLLEEVRSSSEEVVKMGKENHNKGYNIKKLTPPPSLRLEEILPKQKEKIKEVLDIKYKELEESKPILEVLENYVMYKKKLDEILIGKERLNKKEFSEEDKVGIIEHGLPKKMCDPGNYVLPVKINGVVEMVALVDTGASVSVLPYSLYKDLGLGDPRPYQTNLTMADNTQAKAMGEVKNVRIQIGYQAYVVDLLILDILVDPELPLLLGRPFLRTCGAIIDMGRGTLCIDDGVIRHTYFPKPRSKSYVEAFEMEGEDDWLGSFEVGRDEDGNVKYGPVAPSFIDIEYDMERALAMDAYFNPFKKYWTYKKVNDDGDWHARFEIVTPSGRKFNRAFKTKTTTRKLSGKFKTEDVLSLKDTLPNPLIAEYERRNKRNTITYSLQPVSNANLKWRDLPSVDRHAYCEKLSKLQERSFGVPRVANWRLFDAYGFEDTLREMMKLEYIYEGDGDIFVDYSWERALSIDNEIYPEWVLEFFSTLYFDKDVDRNNLMKEKCIWFRLCGHEHILTLPEFVVVLEPLMRIVHKVIMGSLVHRVASRERCQKRDLWMMSALEESRGVNLAWIIADHLYNHVPGTKENSVICAGHYVTKIAYFLGYCVDDEIKKCSELIVYEYWISKMLADELDVENTCLKKETKMPTQAEEGSSELRQEHGGLNLSWRDWNASLRPSYGLGGDDYFTSAMPDFRGSSSEYAVGGSSRGDGFNDDDDMDE
ncbi:retrovirus-related pol polyprotein from transposon TNT 1-94 [Tanacetum coccineum]